MNELRLHKISENEYAIFGTKEYCYTEYKTVEVDGEIYHKTKSIDAVMDMEEEFNKGKLDTFETDFLQYFGLPEIKLHYKSWMYSNTMENLCRVQYSQNAYVYFLMFLEHYNLLPKQIGKLYNGKCEFSYCKIGDYPEYVFNIIGYGYNNFVTFDISAQDIIKYDIPHYKIKYAHGYSDFRLGFKIEEMCDSSINKLDRLLKQYDKLSNLYKNNKYDEARKHKVHV